MKKIIFFVLLATVVSCTNDGNTEPKSPTITFSKTDSELGFTPKPIRAPRQAGVKQLMDSLKAQVKVNNDFFRRANIEIIKTEASILRRKQANENYETFVEENRSHPNINSFRSKYAAVVLNNYGYLKTQDFDRIKFYTEELINTHSQDFELIKTSLSKLKSGLNKSDLAALKTKSMTELRQIIDKQLDTEAFLGKRIQALEKNINQKMEGNMRPEFQLALMQQSLKDLKITIEKNQGHLSQIGDL